MSGTVHSNTQWNENVSSGILQNIYTERKWNSWIVLKLQAEAAYEILINFIFGNLLNVSLSSKQGEISMSKFPSARGFSKVVFQIFAVCFFSNWAIANSTRNIIKWGNWLEVLRFRLIFSAHVDYKLDHGSSFSDQVEQISIWINYISQRFVASSLQSPSFMRVEDIRLEWRDEINLISIKFVKPKGEGIEFARQVCSFHRDFATLGTCRRW